MKIKAQLEKMKPKSFMIDYLESCGVVNPNKYLKTTPKDLESTDKYLNIFEACSAIHKGIEENKRFGILVDCDVDGYSSAAIAYMFLKSQGIEPIIYHHNGKQHGIHTDENFVDRFLFDDLDIIWLPDAGSNDISECRELQEAGITVIITDHHEIEKENPYAIVVNNVMGNVNNVSLSGAGVTAKVVEHYCSLYGIEKQDYNDLIAFSLISDSCDMTKIENRAIYDIVWRNKIRE